MIGIGVKLTGNLTSGLDQFEKSIREKVTIAGAAAMAKVIYDEVRLNATRNKKTGKLHDAIYRVYSPEKSNGALQTYRVSWNRKKAPHGHLIEFGSSHAPAYPFVRPAFDHVSEAIDAGMVRMSEKMDEIKGAP